MARLMSVVNACFAGMCSAKAQQLKIIQKVSFYYKFNFVCRNKIDTLQFYDTNMSNNINLFFE